MDNKQKNIGIDHLGIQRKNSLKVQLSNFSEFTKETDNFLLKILRGKVSPLSRQ